jgi:ATP-dependent DNA helicase RecQ
MAQPAPAHSIDDLKEIIQRHWGFPSFRPLQERAMQAVLDGRDSVVVLPTGGGKSLCYQAPAVLRGGTTVVLSPLISLMKDQVDSLHACGIHQAVQLDSSQAPEAQRAAYERLRDGKIKLLFLSPEKLVLSDLYQLLRDIGVRTFAIDEAHCISHWGHDFRPEYRQLGRIKELFPHAAVHAYTATATERVRTDIVQQLGLRDPEILVGNFDRSNLNYRVLPRHDLLKQVLEVIERHPHEAGIIYCITRREVDELAATLQQRGLNVRGYHAGLGAEERSATQEAFAAEKIDLIVATVAFGMGIDRSNIRFVLHTGMPKSIEHYQQETGRAGRDGLEAECVLLHSGADFASWKYLIEKSAQEGGAGDDYLASAMKHLSDMDRYARGAVCRHRALVEYFGQTYRQPSCAACDMCLGDNEPVPDAVVIAQKILSCVARVNECFGIGHIIDVLRGSDSEKVRKFGHEKLTTYGLLRDKNKDDVRDWIYQLISQQVLRQHDLLLPSGDKVSLLGLTEGSWEVMRGQRSVRLVQLVRRKKGERAPRSGADTVSWEGVDRELFDSLRSTRSKLAEERSVPPYIIFTDSTLRELARVRPSTLERMRYISGIGDAKLRDYGDRFLQIIRQHCTERGVGMDNRSAPRPAVARAGDRSTTSGSARPNPLRTLAFEQFRQGAAIEDVMHQTGRARATICDYLSEFVREERPKSIAAWVPDAVYQRIAMVARRVGTERLKPIYIELGEQVSYDVIRLVVSHLSASGP